MRAALLHRGPDEGSTDAFGHCVLGHQRLKVIDLDTGYQPVTNETGDVVAVYNGETYNFRELRDELDAVHEVRGTGDTPVLPHLYEESGPRSSSDCRGCLRSPSGTAARERLVLARDRLGKKPLLWTRLPDGTLAFASELKALLRLPQSPRDIDLAAARCVSGAAVRARRRTGLRGIHKLAPGHVLVAEGGTASGSSATGEPSRRSASAGEQEWLERVRGTVGEAVRKRLVADVPLGALLSGGIDSSIVVALMAQASSRAGAHVHGRLRRMRVTTSVPMRALVATRYGTVHEELEIEEDVAATLPATGSDLRRAARRRGCVPDLPDRRAGARGMSRSRLRVTVATNRSRATSAMRRSHSPGAFRAPVAKAGASALRALPAARREPRSPLFRAARFLDVAATPAQERYARLMEVFPLEARQRALGRSPAWRARRRSRRRGPGITGLQQLDLETYLPGDLLLKADLASMAHSLELRSPFLDHEVVALGLALPDSLKVRGREGKVALRRAFADLLPAEVADARQDRASACRSAAGFAPICASSRMTCCSERPRLVPARGRSAPAATSTNRAAPIMGTGSGAC